MQIKITDTTGAATERYFEILTSGTAIYESPQFTSEDWQSIPFFIGTTFTLETDFIFYGRDNVAGDTVTVYIQILGYQTGK